MTSAAASFDISALEVGEGVVRSEVHQRRHSLRAGDNIDQQHHGLDIEDPQRDGIDLSRKINTACSGL